jgi:Sulphur globule protein
MKKILFAAAVAGLMGAAANADAWWGWPFGGWGPWNNGWGNDGWGNDWFGDGWFDFNLSMGLGGHGWGRGNYYDYYAPYWGYPYGGWGAPYGYGYPYAVVPVVPQAPAPTKSK